MISVPLHHSAEHDRSVAFHATEHQIGNNRPAQQADLHAVLLTPSKVVGSPAIQHREALSFSGNTEPRRPLHELQKSFARDENV